MLYGEESKEMNIIEKLRESKIDLEIEAVVSLPIINSIGEFVFVYFTKSNGSKDSYSLDKIKCIYELPFETEKIETKSVDAFFPKRLLEEAKGAIVKPTIFGMEAIEKEEQCIDLYYEIVDSIRSNGISSDNVEMVQKYQDVLFQLIPESVLRDLYKHLLKM